MIRVGFIGSPRGVVPESFCNSSEYLMQHSGQNLGNLAFWLGFTRLVGGNVLQVRWNDNPEALKNRIDVLVIAAANFLMESNDLSILRDLVEILDKPVLISGLVAQSEDESKIPELKDGTIGFLKAVSSRCENIGVRGDFSKKVCEYYDVKNITNLGCPSILINNNQNLGKEISLRWNEDPTHISSASASIKENLRSAESKLFNLIDHTNGKYIIQRPAALLKVIRHESLNETDLEYIEKFRKFINPEMTTSYLYNFLRKNSTYFTTAHSWLEYLKCTSHAVGTRIHGSILPISAGVPSICITHDTRTRELSKSVFIPSITSTEFSQFDGTINDLFRTITFDEIGFYERRRELATNYERMFRSVGINISAHLKSFL
ncbi:polysaccharide pyruvyl transferase family protein [Amphritea pacifica]|uniref:Polysaccharide pyruvyl transferase family protein n=1 Tax=Amphritea pacifica TaxID=2811233 RepID=A0ABS2W5L0_9GAMM|nr:polysaccharide pyruvyl transferase family protein [Amphritea pacifica]MBN0987001.1 polysaccharide pyruvyl transferase family protein [Amphritea pacifica]